MTPDPVTPVPSLLGFTLGEPLGQGGFARVWAALREGDGAPSAIKVAHARGALSVERFRREASALERIGSPHVPALYGLGQLEDGRPYLAMERRFERTLQQELREQKAPPDLAFAARRADAILGALAGVHAHGITHRDLKPANIFITQPEERAVLIDLGLALGAPVALAAGAPLTRPGVALGTLMYMAPEQIRCDPVIDARADIYAFGVILFELLTRRTPFIGDAGAIEYGHLSLRPPRPSEIVPVPAEVEELLLACMAKDKARRPGSVVELRRALDEACAPSSEPAPSVSAPSSRGVLVSQAGHPAVLLVVESSRAAPVVISVVTSRRGFVVRRRGHRYVCVFLAGESGDPSRAALAAARELVDRHGARAALHLGSVTLWHRGQGPPAVHGTPVDRPEVWLPAEPWFGLKCTPEIEQVLGGPVEAAEAAEVTVEEGPPLIGRDDVCAALAESAARAFDGTCPALFTLLGEDGIGKTRLAVAAVHVGRSAAPGARVILLNAAPGASEVGEAKETATLFRWVMDRRVGGAASHPAATSSGSSPRGSGGALVSSP